MKRKIAVIVVLALSGLGAFWALSLFLGATHGLAVRRSHIRLAKINLADLQTWLSTNSLDTNYLARFQVVPCTNTYAVGGRTFRAVLRTGFGWFEGQGDLVLTSTGDFLFVYQDPSQPPRLVDENYSPPPLPSWKY
jgi:hypothetical protein